MTVASRNDAAAGLITDSILLSLTMRRRNGWCRGVRTSTDRAGLRQRDPAHPAHSAGSAVDRLVRHHRRVRTALGIGRLAAYHLPGGSSLRIDNEYFPRDRRVQAGAVACGNSGAGGADLHAVLQHRSVTAAAGLLRCSRMRLPVASRYRDARDRPPRRPTGPLCVSAGEFGRVGDRIRRFGLYATHPSSFMLEESVCYLGLIANDSMHSAGFQFYLHIK